MFADLKSLVDARFGGAPKLASPPLGSEDADAARGFDDDPDRTPAAAPAAKCFSRGVYRSDEAPGAEPYARVRFKSGDIDVPEVIYREVGLEPEFRSLPTRAEYVAQGGSA